MHLIRSITTVGCYTIGSRVFGFMREILTASLLGAGAAADGLVFAIKFPTIFRRLFAEGAFNASFVPLFAGLLATKGEQEARSFAEQILTLWVLALFLLIALIELFLPLILPLIVPGFSKTPDRLYYAISFSRVTFPFIFFISISALYSGILNSYNKFVAAASSPMIGNVVIVSVVLSVQHFFHSPGYAFAWAIMLSGFSQCAWVIIPAFRKGMGLRLVWPKFDHNVLRFFKIMAPAAFGAGVVQINIFIGTFIASWLPTGAISYLSYADRLNQLPLSVIGVAVSTVLLPTLSRQIRSHSWNEAHQTQNQVIEFSMFLTLPAALVLFLFAHPLIMVVFERGAFGIKDTLSTAFTLKALAFGLPAYVLIKIFTSSFFARQDTRTPIYTASIAIVVDIFLSVLLMHKYHQVGIAFATAISAWVNATALGYLLWRQGHLLLEKKMLRFGGRLCATCVATIFLLYGMEFFIRPFLVANDFVRSSIVLGLLGSGILGFLLFSHIMGAFKFKELKLLFART